MITNTAKALPRNNLELPMDALAHFCLCWHISELALFGSVLRLDFRADSDVDVLATFGPQTHWTLLDCVRMEQELARIFGRRVDLVSRRAVEQSSNPIRRRQILASAESLYVA